MDAQSKKRSRIALAALTLALLVCATVPAIWFGARFWAVTAIDTWREQERLAGREWTCATPATSGFPFRLVYVCPEPTVRFAGRAGAAHATARSLEISASLADPLLLEARLSGPFTFAETAGPNASFDWKRFEVDLRFGLTGLRDSAMRIEGLEATAQDPQLNARRIAADSIALAVRGLDRDAADLSASATGLDAPDAEKLTGLRDLIGLQFAGRLMRPDLLNLADMPFAIDDWRGGGGELEVSRFDLSQGAASVVLDGRLGLDDRRRARGSLNVAATGLDPVLRRYGLSPAALSIGNVLGGLLGGRPKGETPTGGGPTLRLPLALRDGFVFVGPVRAPLVLLPLY